MTTTRRLAAVLLAAWLPLAAGCHPRVTLALPQADSAEILQWRESITRRVNELTTRIQALEEQQQQKE